MKARHRRRGWAALGALVLLLLTVGPAAATTYEDMLWADWPTLPSDQEIQQALAAIDQDDRVGDYTIRTVAVEAVKVHALDPDLRLGGQAGTGNHCVAVETIETSLAGSAPERSTRVWPLFYHSGNVQWEFGVAAMEATESLEAWYAWGYAEGWVNDVATAPGAVASEAPVPWRTVAGWFAAVLAAAAAIAGAAGSARRGPTAGEGAQDPGRPVGHVLHLSSDRIRVGANVPAELTATAYDVLPDGTLRPAPGAQVSILTPAGLSARPNVAPGSVRAAVAVQGAARAGPAHLTVRAVAASGGTTAEVTVEPAEEPRLVVRFSPTGPTSLRTDGRHRLTLVATVEPAPGPPTDPAAVRASITFEPVSRWLEISEAVDYGQGRAVAVQASQLDPAHPVPPPDSASVRVTALVGAQSLETLLAVPLEPLPEVDVHPDSVSFALGSGRSADVAVWVENHAGQAWDFTTAWREHHPPLATVDLAPTGDATAMLSLTESGTGRVDQDRPETTATLRVIASAQGFEPAERHVRVSVTQEGLFVDPTGADPATGAFLLRADGSATPTEVGVRVFLRDEATGVVGPDLDLARAVVVDLAGEEGTSGTAGLRAGGFTANHTGVRPANVPSAVVALAMTRALPTGGRPLTALVRCTVPGFGAEPFAADVPLRLLGVDTEPFSSAWWTEFARCQHVIDAFVPAEYGPRLHRLLAERAQTMGAEGLYAMRTQLWSFARDQLVREAHEHLDAAWWAEQIESTLDWISWCGDIALGVASGTFVGTIGSVAIGLLKPLLVSAMEAVVYGRSLEQWVENQVAVLGIAVEGAVVDTDLLTMLTGQKRALAWAVFVAYHFAKELLNEPTLSVTNAMNNVGRQLRDEGLVIFLRRVAGVRPAGMPAEPRRPATDSIATGRAPSSDGPGATRRPDAPDGARGPERPATPDAVRPGPASRPNPRARADAMAADIRTRTADGGKVDVRTVERILRDPDAMRELKKRYPDVWRDFHETRARIYEAHDAQLKKWIRENLPDAKDRTIEVESFGTKDGVDRDYRAGYVIQDPATGARRFIEIPKERWAGRSHEIFAAETGGPTDPAGSAKWAKDHQQLATDAYHAEASVDMADQAWATGPDGRRTRTQVEPNVERVKRGETTLLDPDGLGKTYETKVAEAYQKGHLLDAYLQADKAVDSLEGVRRGYADQHYGIRDVPPKMAAGMEVIRDVQAGRLDPTAAEARLRNLDYDGLTGFMERISGQIGSLRWARRA